MACYFFPVQDGCFLSDKQGTECATVAQARTHAAEICVAIKSESKGRRFWDGDEWQITVTSESGNVVWTLSSSSAQILAVGTLRDALRAQALQRPKAERNLVTGMEVLMPAPMPADVRAAIHHRRQQGGDGMVSVKDIAAELACAFNDEGKLIELMLQHMVITECARLGYPMKLTTEV